MNRSLLSDETPLVRSFVEACFSVGDESWREMGRSVCDSLMAEKGENWEKNAVFVLRVSFEKECEAAGIHTDEVSPKILPDYRRKK